MEILKCILMGIVQGVTEIVPVSSSAHFNVMRRVFGFECSYSSLFYLMLHIGTIASICIALRKDIFRLIKETLGIVVTLFANLLVFFMRIRGNKRYAYFRVINSSYRKIAVMILISSIPTAIMGYYGREFVSKISDRFYIVGIGVLITGFLLYLVDELPESHIRADEAMYSGAFITGISQGVAALPGLSRTGVTLSAGLLMGYDKMFAFKYSLLVSVPALIGSVIVQANNVYTSELKSDSMPAYIVGMIAAGIVGFIAIKCMMKIVRRRKYKWIGIYCLVLGAAIFAYSIFG